jgi:hypothetical protein
VYWAVWFHDVIYDVNDNRNEEASAELAASVLTSAGLEPPTVLKVAAYIRATAAHECIGVHGRSGMHGGGYWLGGHRFDQKGDQQNMHRCAC